VGRSFSPDFKREIVKLILEEGMSQSKVCSDYDLSVKTVHGWVKQAKDSGVGSFVGSGKQIEDLSQPRKDAKRIRDLEEQVEILKKAMRIFTEKPR
jgi:transposase